MQEKIITIYCLCADFLIVYGQKDEPQAQMSTAEVMPLRQETCRPNRNLLTKSLVVPNRESGERPVHYAASLYTTDASVSSNA